MKIGRLEINLKWHRRSDEWYCTECGKLGVVQWCCPIHLRAVIDKRTYEAIIAGRTAPRTYGRETYSDGNTRITGGKP